MGLDRSGSACGNLARSDAQYGGYASRKTLHPRIGSANPHTDRDTYSDAHPDVDTNWNLYHDPHTFAESNCHAYKITDLTPTNANIDASTIRADHDAGDRYSLIDDIV